MCDHCHIFVDCALSGCIASWAGTMEEDFTFQWGGGGYREVECLTAELVRLTGIVKGMEMRMSKETYGTESDDRETGRKQQSSDKKDEERKLRGGRASARKTDEERTTENLTCRKVTWEKVTVEKDGRTMGQERREVHVTEETMKGRKEVRVDVSKGKLITGMVTGRKDAGKLITEKAARGKFTDLVEAKWRSYSEAVIEGALRTERVFMGDFILRKTDKTLSKGEDVVVCLPGARIEHVNERV